MNAQSWKKCGLIFDPQRPNPWFISHAALPVARTLNQNSCRVYFSGRDAEVWHRLDILISILRTPPDLQPVRFSGDSLRRIGHL